MSTRRVSSPAVESARSRGAEVVRNFDLSSTQLGSSEIARDINRDIILELIRFRQPVSRIDLSGLSGLQPSTVSAIVEELVAEKWIKKGAIVQGLRGRPATMLSVNDDLVTLAVDLRPDRAILAVVDLSGRFLAQETVINVSNAAQATDRIIDRMQQLRSHFSDKSFEGVGVSVPGRVHPITQKILLAPNLKWHDFDLKGALEKGLGLQVELDNDANACLLSELWYGRLEGVRNAVLVAVSEGIGTALLIGGQLQSGFNGLAGEFGHIPIDSSGPLCGCGKHGCWETLASSQAALQFYRKMAPGSPRLTIQELLRLAEEKDKTAEKAISQQMKALGRGLQLITAALSPELILITGEITSCWKKYGPIVRKELESTMLIAPAPSLKTAGDGYLARLSGAAAMLLQRHSRYHRSTRRSKTRKELPPATHRPSPKLA
jgi:predicted NBD/HSP70 family sugar kinase